MSRFSKSVGLLLLVALGVGSIIGYRHYREQNRLISLLQQLDYAVSLRNAEAARSNENAVKSMEVAVVKNQNMPRELVALRRARTLETCVNVLLDTLRSCRDQLRRASGNPVAPTPLRHAAEQGSVARLLGRSTRARHALQLQLTTCTNTIRQLGAADSVRLVLPDFDHLPLAEALAALTQLESRILAHELATFQYMTRQVGARRLPIRFVAAATAETNAVAPGSTYQGHLMLIKSISGVIKMGMFCDGRPIPIGSDGVGQVQLRAPTKPGPVSWTATIHFNQSGRDTTFQTQVQYRVARP